MTPLLPLAGLTLTPIVLWSTASLAEILRRRREQRLAVERAEWEAVGEWLTAIRKIR